MHVKVKHESIIKITLEWHGMFYENHCVIHIYVLTEWVYLCQESLMEESRYRQQVTTSVDPEPSLKGKHTLQPFLKTYTFALNIKNKKKH